MSWMMPWGYRMDEHLSGSLPLPEIYGGLFPDPDKVGFFPGVSF